MIISASRRTDIPAFYSAWFLQRLRAGFVWVPNPYNPRSVARVRLDPAAVECIVFWTKNPAPMLARLDGLAGYDYYFQYTLNACGRDAEPGLPPLSERIATFRRLADRIGKERVVWRYDPLFRSGTTSAARHREAFAQIAEALEGYTERCVLGFLDPYPHLRRTLAAHGIEPLSAEEIEAAARSFRQTAAACGLRLETCTNRVDLRRLGIPAGACVDRELIARITGASLAARKDRSQRPECSCIESIDIGTYESCPHGCIYCYAVRSRPAAAANRLRHDPASPLLLGTPDDLPPGTVIRDREMKSLKTPQGRKLDF